MERCAAKGVTDVRVLREPGAARAADDPRQGPLLGSGDGRRERPRDGRASMHVGSSSQMPQDRPDARSWPTSPGVPSRTSGAMLSWLFSGMFQRFPNLKIALSEGEIGWMPVLPRARRAGARQAAPLGQAGHAVHGPRRHRGRPRRRSTSGRRSATTSSAASSRTTTASPASTRSARTT